MGNGTHRTAVTWEQKVRSFLMYKRLKMFQNFFLKCSPISFCFTAWCYFVRFEFA